MFLRRSSMRVQASSCDRSGSGSDLMTDFDTSMASLLKGVQLTIMIEPSSAIRSVGSGGL